MDKKILGFNQDTVFAAIIVLVLIILGVITFHYYAFVTAGDKSVFSAGFGAGFKFMPLKQKEQKEHLDGAGILAEAQNTLANARANYCNSNKCTKEQCHTRCKLAGCPCQ